MDLVAQGCRPVELLNRHKVPCIISLNVRKNLVFSATTKLILPLGLMTG